LQTNSSRAFARSSLIFVAAGGHINGIARINLSNDTQWEWINFNMLGDDLWQNETIVNRIAVDPENGEPLTRLQCSTPLLAAAVNYVHMCI